MSAPVLPLWAEITVAVFVLAGAALALLGSIGLLRLPTFFERVHAPAIIATLATWCVLLGTVLSLSLQRGQLTLQPLLIAIFIAITVPVTTIFLMRASLFRARQTGLDAPPNISRPAPQGTNNS
ncbi:MAG: monovalent cation/H(+) antiporter subunit G [Polaromonas sp.]